MEIESGPQKSQNERKDKKMEIESEPGRGLVSEQL